METLAGDLSGHGTCVASIACSHIGIMIKGTLVSVKCNNGGDISTKDTWKAFGTAIINIVTEKRKYVDHK